MAYELDDLVADCRAAIGGEPDLQQVCDAMQKALANPAFVDAHFPQSAEPGRTTLYHDPELGFYIYAHVPNGAILSPPHDHATAWAAYGQARAHTQMTDWEIPAGQDKPVPVRTYRLLPGMAGYYDIGAFHSIDMPETSRFLRITATDIDDLPCKYFDEIDTRKTIAEYLEP